MFETEKSSHRQIAISELNLIEVKNLNIINEDDILFVEHCNSEMYFLDKNKKLYHINLDKIDIDNVKKKYVQLKNYNKYFNVINLGMGHVLLIKNKIYDNYMKLLKNKITYENEYEDCYYAYCYWMECAIDFINNYNSYVLVSGDEYLKYTISSNKLDKFDGLFNLIVDKKYDYKMISDKINDLVNNSEKAMIACSYRHFYIYFSNSYYWYYKNYKYNANIDDIIIPKVKELFILFEVEENRTLFEIEDIVMSITKQFNCDIEYFIILSDIQKGNEERINIFYY